MWRQRLGIILTIALGLALSFTGLTGFLAAALDLNRFSPHIYGAYASLALALGHLCLHYRALAARLRAWLGGRGLDSRSKVARAQGVSPQPARAYTPQAGPPVGSAAWRFTRRALLLGLPLALGFLLGRWGPGGAATPARKAASLLGGSLSYLDLPALAMAVQSGLRPPLYKRYPNAPRFALPQPTPTGALLEETILRRRSLRDYGGRPLTLAELSNLLRYAAGITDRRDPTHPFRAQPSAGALYPVEIYPVVLSVAGLEPGIYHYAVEAHGLELLREGDFRSELFRYAVAQEMVARAGVVFVFTVYFPRIVWKYRERSARYALIEAGHIGQNFYLLATALGLGPCAIGAFLDDEVNGLLGLEPQEETAAYLLVIGTRP